MSEQKPIVGLGTVLPIGTVVSIRKDRVGVSGKNGVEYFTFTQIEGMVLNG